MEVDLKKIKQLKDLTGAALLECKFALKEAKGNIPNAIKILQSRQRDTDGLRW